MGLDWKPMGKPKPGSEERFNQLYRLIQGIDKPSLSFLDKLKGKKGPTKEVLLAEWFSIQIPSYETISAPKVNRDAVAGQWLKEKYEASDKTVPFEKFAKDADGYYVIELAPESDGIPVYIAMHADRNVFRAQFLKDCEDIIGKELLNEAWETKLAEPALQYGQQLMKIADQIALENNLQAIKDQRLPPDVDEDSVESKLHIIYAASKWLIYYGGKGHGYEADF